MDQNLKSKTLDGLTKAENISIVVSSDVGFDAIAAGLALYLSLIKLDKNVSIIAKLPSVKDAQSLYAVDRIGKIEGSTNPVIVVDNAIETVEKVTYFLEDTKLKVIIHPLPGVPKISSSQIAVEYSNAPTGLIFALGFNSLHDLRSKITHEQEISPESLIVNINNQQMSQKFAQIDIINPQASGIAEVTAKMIQDFALPIDEDIAYNLYVGIKQSTQSFSPDQASTQTLEIASWLVKFGAGRASLARSSHQSHPPLIDSQSNLGQNIPPKIFQDKPQANLKRSDMLSQFSQIFNPVPPHSQNQNTDFATHDNDFLTSFDEPPPIEQVERKQNLEDKWLKPPKIYKGSKSFDKEN